MDAKPQIRVTAAHAGLVAPLPPGDRMRRRSVKAFHHPVRLPDGRVQIGSCVDAVDAEISDPHTEATWYVPEWLAGGHGPEEISRIASAAFPDLRPRRIRVGAATRRYPTGSAACPSGGLPRKAAGAR